MKRGRPLVSLTSFKWAALSNGSGLRCEILFIAANLAAAEASPSMLLTWSSYFFFSETGFLWQLLFYSSCLVLFLTVSLTVAIVAMLLWKTSSAAHFYAF